MNKIGTYNWLFIISSICILAIVRIVLVGDGNSYSSYTPLGAICLFSGAYLGRKWFSYAIPFAVLLISDLVINCIIYKGQYGIISQGWYLTYGVMMAIVLIGTLIYKKVAAKKVVLSGIASTLLFWGVMDFAVWASGGINIVTGLPLTFDFAGLMQAYIQGIPFVKNFFVGTTIYSALLFGSYEFFKNKVSVFNVA